MIALPISSSHCHGVRASGAFARFGRLGSPSLVVSLARVVASPAKKGWSDLDAVQERIVAIREAQRAIEPAFLKAAEARNDVRPAWELMAQYHLAKAAEILGAYVGQGSVDGHYDIRQQLEAQFDRAIGASARGQLVEQETLSRLLARSARVMVDNSIWTVTRSVNSRVTRFVQSLTARDQGRPIFEMLPPQRRTLREEGLLGLAIDQS